MKKVPGVLARLLVVLSMVAASVSAAVLPQRALAEGTLTVEPLTWNVIGLDSNNVNVGPNRFPIGVRVCNKTDAPLTHVVGTFVWDSADPYINLTPGTSSTQSAPTLATGACTDLYYEVQITRDAAAYNHARRYHVAVTAEGGVTASSPIPRELFVERLISQNRNATNGVSYGTTLDSLTPVPAGGSLNLAVGETYYIKLDALTATQGYEQLESFINLPNTSYQILSVATTYTAESSTTLEPPYTQVYGDGCTWVNDPTSPNYRSCSSTGKAGGTVTVTYQVKILAAPPSGSGTLSTLIYDFSGSSFHYNADYAASTRYVNVVSPILTKTFSPKTITPGQLATLTFKITNPGSSPLNNVSFSDTFPSGVTVAESPSPAVIYTGCGTAASPTTLTGGSGSLSFSGITVVGSGTCTITINSVTSSETGSHANTTTDLIVDGTNTGSKGADTLVVVSAAQPPPTTCEDAVRIPLASWTFPTTGQGSGGGATSPDWSYRAPDVASAAASGVGGAFTIETSRGNPVNSWASAGWPKDGTSTPPANPSIYYQFSVDSSNYGALRISYQHFLLPSDWGGTGNTNYLYEYSAADGGTYSNVSPTYVPATNAWTSRVYGAAQTGQGTTSFRISASGASNAQKNLYLDNVTITGCPRGLVPTLSKTFTPATIAQGDTSTLSFLITNPNTTIALTGVSFTDVLPSGLVVADPDGASVNCSAGTMTNHTIPAVPGSSIISLSGATLSTNAACTLTVTVTGTAAGTYQNLSGYITSAETGPNTTSTGYGTANLTVIAPPLISKVFGAGTIQTGSTTTLTFRVTNPNSTTELTGVSFTDSLPTGLPVADPNGLTGPTCTTGTISSQQIAADANSTSISLSGATLSAGASCSFALNVTGTTSGLKENAVTVSSTNGGTGNTSTALLLVKDVTPAISLLKQVSLSPTGPWSTILPLGASTMGAVYYRFVVENIGDMMLDPVTLTDPQITLTGCTWLDGDGTSLSSLTKLPSPDADNQHYAVCVAGPVTIDAAQGSSNNTATASGTYNGATVNDASSGGVLATDWGDNPLSYDGDSSTNAAGHSLYPDTTGDGKPDSLNAFRAVWLGATVDAALWSDATHTAAADGDDDAPRDDEDGVALDCGKVRAGGQDALTVSFSSSQASGCSTCYLVVWVDWDRNGQFDALEAALSQPVSWTGLSATQTLDIAVPTGELTAEALHYRVRLFPSAPASPAGAYDGLAINGEVEDYVMESTTAVTLTNLTASTQGEAIEVAWDTANEADHLGFNLYRATSADEPGSKLNAALIPAQEPGSPLGHHYSYLDAAGLTPGTTYWYALEDVSMSGEKTRHAAVSVTFGGGPTAVGLARFDARPAAWMAVLATVVAALAAVGLWVAGGRLKVGD